MKEIFTKPLWPTSKELGWEEPFVFRTRLRGDVFRRLMLCVGVSLILTGIVLGVFSQAGVPPDWRGVLFLGVLCSLVAFQVFFRGRDKVNGSVALHLDGIRRITSTWGGYVFFRREERWGYHEISKCVFIPAKAIGCRFYIIVLVCGGSRDMIAVPRRIAPKRVVGILQNHGVRVLRGSGLPEYATRGLSPLMPPITLVGGVFTLAVGLLLFFGQSPPEKEQTAQHPQFPGMKDMRDAYRESSPRRINPLDTGTTAVTQDNRERELDDMKQMRDSMRRMRDGMPPMGRSMPPMRDGMRGMREGMVRDRPPTFGPPSRPPGFAPPGSSRADNAQPGNYDLSETIGGTGGVDFKKVDSQGRPVIGVQFSLGSWAGKEHVGRLTPLFDRSRATRPNTIFAKEGYALGAIHVWAGEFVDGVTLEFMKLKDGRSLQLSDSYKADIIGRETTAAAKIIKSDGRLVIGLHGRGAAVMDAIGLVLSK
ncbi:MAG: hypothetical protein ACYS8Z_03665 [Planctomycetota bacterium]